MFLKRLLTLNAMFYLVSTLCGALVVALAFLKQLQLQSEYSLIVNRQSSLKLIGDLEVTRENAKTVAKSFLREFEAIFDETHDWFEHSDSFLKKTNMRLSSIKVSGEFMGTTLQRANWSMPCDGKSADLYSFLISPSGFAVIDPITPISEHLKSPVARLAFQ